ncbi:MAG: nucleotidyltransferase domain-containing protein [Oscillatoriales cyanobacterium]|nr:MAG: nucleotidyltransferase domain-containing protein [Oscillatoriales cyanobacterium]
MNINDRLKTILTDLRSHFEQIYDSRLVTMVLYGSQARGDERPDSDIDVLVVLKGQVNPGEEIKRTSHIRADLSLQNDEVISCLFMDEQRFMHEQLEYLDTRLIEKIGDLKIVLDARGLKPGFLRKYFVPTHRLGKKPGFFGRSA